MSNPGPATTVGSNLVNVQGEIDSTGAFTALNSPNGNSLSIPDGIDSIVTTENFGNKSYQGKPLQTLPRIYAEKPRLLKRFVDLANVVFTLSNATSVNTIDQNSPFGGPAMKIVLTPTGAAPKISIDLTNINIPNFDDNVCASVWFQEVNRINTTSVWLSDSSAFTSVYSQWARPMFTGTNSLGGPRMLWGGPMLRAITPTTVGGGFVPGTTTLNTVRLQIQGISQSIDPNLTPVTFWIKDIYIPAKQRPIVCFTWDDGYSSWNSRVAPILKANGVKGTFGVESTNIGLGTAFPTASDIQDLADAGHQITVHNVNNFAVKALAQSGTGELGGATAISTVSYIAEYISCRKTLEALSIDPFEFCYHPWVQGIPDTETMYLLKSDGVEIARAGTTANAQPYGPYMGNNVMFLDACALRAPSGSLYTLDANKQIIDDAVKYGALAVFMGHITGDTSSDSVTYSEADLSILVKYAAQQDCDILTMRELRDRFQLLKSMVDPDTNPAPPSRMIASLLGANFNSTADQPISLPQGTWIVNQVYIAKPSTSLAASSVAGGVYTSTAKGGTVLVSSAQTYSTLVATTDVLTATMTTTPTITVTAAVVATSLYLSLTTGHGSTVTTDVHIFGIPA